MCRYPQNCPQHSVGILKTRLLDHHNRLRTVFEEQDWMCFSSSLLGSAILGKMFLGNETASREVLVIMAIIGVIILVIIMAILVLMVIVCTSILNQTP